MLKSFQIASFSLYLALCACCGQPTTQTCRYAEHLYWWL